MLVLRAGVTHEVDMLDGDDGNVIATGVHFSGTDDETISTVAASFKVGQMDPVNSVAAPGYVSVTPSHLHRAGPNAKSKQDGGRSRCIGGCRHMECAENFHLISGYNGRSASGTMLLESMGWNRV